MLIDLLKSYLSKVRTEQLAAAFLCFLLIWGFLLKRKGKLCAGILLFCTVYSTFVLAVTFLGRSSGEAVTSVKDLFSTWKGVIEEKKISDMYEVVLNTLLFLPFGMIVTACGSGRKKTVLLSLVTSLILELFQLLSGRGVFEICDLVHNTLGGYLGAVVYARAAELFFPGPFRKQTGTASCSGNREYPAQGRNGQFPGE